VAIAHAQDAYVDCADCRSFKANDQILAEQLRIADDCGCKIFNVVRTARGDEIGGGMWGRSGLIGDTGYVGGTLMRSVSFAKTYNSQTIDEIADQSFDTLVCAGAPATMWAANSNPDADRMNLERLASALESVRIGRCILISTIAVLDNPSAGYTESTARYEMYMAYGRHRRALEERVLERSNAVVLRLPALFGAGLRKNFLFDLLNPVPSFINPEKFAEIRGKLTETERRSVDSVFSLDVTFGLYKLDRTALETGGLRASVEQSFVHMGFVARNFTNSSSRYQYYNLTNLKHDIDVCISNKISVLHVCSEPWGAAELHQSLLGSRFANHGPPIVIEDMQTEHAAAFGRRGPYIYDKLEVEKELKAFFAKRGS
jgi:hypothetical protein